MTQVVLLRGADKRLLKRVHDALLLALSDTAETLASADRKDLLEELLADVAEDLGAKVMPPAQDETEEPEQKTMTLANGQVVKVRG